MTELERRAAICAEARTWLRTPYHHLGWIKGPQGGVDCARFPICVYAAAGVIERFDPGYFPTDYMLHRGEEHYRKFVEQYARPIDPPAKPGDLVIYKVGRVYWHGVIVLDWPQGIHARWKANVELIDCEREPGMLGKTPLVYSLF